MELSTFAEFGIVVGLAATLAIIATKLKQPAILGYILAGLLISFNPYLKPHHEQLELFSKVGITLLLFVLGLELNLGELKSMGRVTILTSVGQIIFSFISGFAIAQILEFPVITSVYIAIGLTFSSTIVVVKLLSLKKQMDSLYGRIAIGILLMQDFVAIMLIIGLSAFGHLESSSGAMDVVNQLFMTLAKGAIAGVCIFLFVRFILHYLLNWIRAEKEVLFMTVIAWALLLAAVMGSKTVGFSLEIGGLIAGIALSGRFEHLQIESWTKPLRDFFLMLFFVMLGLQVNLDSLDEILLPSIIIAIFVMITKPLIVLIFMKYLGYSKKVSFLVALSIAQVSEFSLIVANFAYDMGQVSPSVLALLTIVGGITMTVSSYLIFYNEQFYEFMLPLLSLFRFKSDKNQTSQDDFTPEIVLFGCHRMGRNLLNLIPKYKDEILIIDFDPKTVAHLKEKGFQAIYGDISDIEMYDAFRLNEARIVISTVPSMKENKRLLHHLKDLRHRPISVIMANDDEAAKELYKSGVDFVIYPHLLGGELLSDIIAKGSLTKSMVQLRNRHLETLNVSS